MSQILPRLKFSLAAMLVLVVALSACGLKGDLYLPEEPPQTGRTEDSDTDDENGTDP